MFRACDALDPEFLGQPLGKLWEYISPHYMVDESTWVSQLLPLATPCDAEKREIASRTTRLIEAIRADGKALSLFDALLIEYGLDTREGILLMGLAEALMRIPDAATASALIRDKLGAADFKSHLKRGNSLFVTAATSGLLLATKVEGLAEKEIQGPLGAVNRLVERCGDPVIRLAIGQTMEKMARRFVLGRTIAEALRNSSPMRDKGVTYSFDMLGEAAVTAADAEKYRSDYLLAIETIGRNGDGGDGRPPASSVSIKLSALHPRYEAAQEARVLRELQSTLGALLQRAVARDVAITIDAEEADRLELSLRLFEKAYRSDVVAGWGKFGVAVQAYSKRALPVLCWLNALSRERGTPIPVRLVKGAYWDSEIKLSQQGGYGDYPVYTRKEATDVAYLACAHFLLRAPVRGNLVPQFASHNAQTVTEIAVMAETTGQRDFEFQRLHGMGESLYEHVTGGNRQPLRIYAPVGGHRDLLPYLVRRLLENGANSSFVHRLVDARCPIAALTEHPVDRLRAVSSLRNDAIPLPSAMFPERKNALGINIAIASERSSLERKVGAFLDRRATGGPIIDGQSRYADMIDKGSSVQSVTAPYDRRIEVGRLALATLDQVPEAIAAAERAFPSWQARAVASRCALLEKCGDIVEAHLPELVALLNREAGKTVRDAIDEVREAVDFCRYYASRAETLTSIERRGFDGRMRHIAREGRGVFVTISPWNFPLAIFLGQITAALVAGNTVVAKPAEQTGLIAARAVQLLLKAGFPAGVISLLPGSGAEIGSALTAHPAVAGVAFTGSIATARRVNRTLAARAVAPVPLIAETGGQNAMIVDSTALPQQVVGDVIRGAFGSAGQRCSALRLLYLQEDVADRIIDLIRGAMEELKVGVPYLYDTDVGPVIDAAAKTRLMAHIARMRSTQKEIARIELDRCVEHGDFVAPSAFEIDDIGCLDEEKFGPILHIKRFKANQLPQVVAEINQTGYGLTMGIHSRNETTWRAIEKQARVGNCYINRDQIGAVVGVQPFGGEGLSGTGPKAGGPHYLLRFTRVRYGDG